MANITANSLRSGKRAKDAQGSDPHLSKVVELNSNYRIFLRTWVEDDVVDIAAAMVPGRSCDLDVCNTTFIPYSKDMYSQDETGTIDDLTGLKSWARIARVLHDAQCAREKKNAEAEAERTARELNQPIDQVSLARSLEGIDIKYNGGKAADGTNINPSKSPFISGMQQKMSTRLLVVKLLPNGAPDWKNAKYAVLELSNARINEFIAILDDVNFCDPTKNYLEVGYNYIGADKKAAGKAAKFQGIAASMSLANAFPAEWEQFGKKLVDNIAVGDTLDQVAEIMRARNRNLKGGKGPNDIISAIKTWCAKNAAIFGSINFENENVAWAANDFLNSHLIDSLPHIKEQFEKLAAEQESKKDSSTTSEAPAAPAPASDVLTQAATSPAPAPVNNEAQEAQAIAAAAAVAQAGVAQTMKSVMQSTPDIDLTDELGEI